MLKHLRRRLIPMTEPERRTTRAAVRMRRCWSEAHRGFSFPERGWREAKLAAVRSDGGSGVTLFPAGTNGLVICAKSVRSELAEGEER